MNPENIKFPDVNFEIPKETPNEKSEPSIDGLREKLLSLAEKGKINYVILMAEKMTNVHK